MFLCVLVTIRRRGEGEGCMNWSVVEVVLAVVQMCDGVDTALLASYAQLIRIPKLKPKAKSRAEPMLSPCPSVSCPVS